MAISPSNVISPSNAIISVIKELEECHIHDKDLAEKIQVAIRVIRETGKKRLASARLSCLKVLSPMTTHFSEEQEQLIDLFRELLEKDFIAEDTSGGIDKLAMELAEIVKQRTEMKLLCKINDCFAYVIELYLEHLAAGHFMPMLESGKKELREAQSLLDQRNQALKLSKHAKTNLSLKHTLRLLKEGIRRIKTEKDLNAFKETFGDVVKIADSVINKDFEGVVTTAITLANRYINNLTSAWYEVFLLYRKLSRDAVSDPKKLFTLLMLMSKTDSKSWHLNYGGVEALHRVAVESSDPQIRRLAICGNSEKRLIGLVDFLSFNKFEQSARKSKNPLKTAKKGKIKDQRVQECAYRCMNALFNLRRPEDQEMFSKHFASQNASESFRKWWRPYAAQIQLAEERATKERLEREREQKEMQAQESQRELELSEIVKPAVISKVQTERTGLQQLDDETIRKILLVRKKERAKKDAANNAKIARIVQEVNLKK